VLERIVRGRMVGREKELREARELWHRVGKGDGQLLLISGEPGIGKTRFMREIVTHAEVSGGIALLGECYAESNAPYNPFSQITRQALNHVHHNGLEMPDAVLDDLLKLTPDLRHQYSHVQPNPRLEPEIEQQRLFENMTTFCSTLAKEAPLLLVIDDVHWADSGTLAMLHHFIRRSQKQPVMILITYREVELKESRPFNEMLLELNRQRQGNRLKLKRLKNDQTREMLAAIFAEEVTSEFLDGIYHETDGNPFFIEEVCRALVDSGAVYYQDGQWHCPNIEELEIPQGVQVAVESRLAKFPQDDQEVLRMAAILGREFSFNILLESLDLDEDILIEAVEAAEKAQMVQEVSGVGDVTFTFVHALVPSAIVESVSTLRRRKLHRQAVTAIEKFSPEDYESLAYHSDQAGDYKRAFKYFVLAAKRATSLYAYEEAIRYATQAIEMAPEVSQDNVMLANLYQSRALACETIGRFHQALGDFETTLQIVREEGEHRLEWRALLDLGKLWASQDYNQSKDCFEQALILARQIDDPEVLAGSLNWMGNWHANTENLSQAVDYHQQALEIFEVLEDKHQMANTLDLLGISNLLAGDCVASVGYYDRAITLFRELDDRSRLASSLTGRGNLGGAVYAYSTVAPSIKPSEARRDFEEALHIARQIGSLPGEAWVLWSLGLTFWVQGELGQALEAAQRGLRIASDIGHREWIVGNQTILGFLYVELFAPGEAQRQLEQALGLAEELRSQHWIYRAMGTLAATHHLLGDLGQAQSCLDAVISPQTSMDTIIKRYCWAREAELKLAQGDPALALEITERLIRSAPGIQPGGVITFLWKLKGEVHAALGQFEEAKSLLRAAKENAQENEERFLLWQIHASLGKVFHHLKAQASCEEELTTARALIEELADTLPDEELKQKFLTGANNTLTTL
jgi:tetratricopeptide (TPR) repeat protein